MATEVGGFIQYAGPLSKIPKDSPGFLLFSQYVAAIDALDRSSQLAIQLQHILSHDAVFVTNGGPPVPAAQVPEMLKMREGMLAEFYHLDDIKVVFMEYEDGRMNLMCETTSVSVFKGDEKREDVKVNELLILQLAPANDGLGVGGLWVTEVKTYMDAGPVMTKAKAVREATRDCVK
ncbi:uncharacterized protein BP5553_05555 [Venustampulla echinocandica]|uniref:SnoaL-like domain-containing protein n=1 Tax=Venustampulla echinocandica TaxID=2656787 RepID=A0A370TRG4_9HELO|nr:uncharacterized protein BP5553_05555 [Venustampulla echinocandica]RDL38122.1 hypothetical protein BP5553_05555 [Venustampulla echinocandica]